MANTCPVCGGKLGLLNREKSADGLICATCSNFFYSKLGFRAVRFTTKELAAYWSVIEARRKAFKETGSIYDGDSAFISVDRANRLFYIGYRGKDNSHRMIYSFDEVASYESDAPDDDVLVTETKGGIGRAVIGAAVAGPVGAIVGAATAKTETRKGRSKENASIRFVLSLGESSLPTMVYPGGMTSFLKSCKDSQEKPQATAPAVSCADELLKFKQLLDMGAITEAEYNTKKAQLLGL